MAFTVPLETCANNLLRQNARKPSVPQTKLYRLIFFGTTSRFENKRDTFYRISSQIEMKRFRAKILTIREKKKLMSANRSQGSSVMCYFFMHQNPH